MDVLEKQYQYTNNLLPNIKTAIQSLVNGSPVSEKDITLVEKAFNGVPPVEDILLLYTFSKNGKQLPKIHKFISTSYDENIFQTTDYGTLYRITIAAGSKILPIGNITDYSTCILLFNDCKIFATCSSRLHDNSLYDLVYLPRESINIVDDRSITTLDMNLSKRFTVDAFFNKAIANDPTKYRSANEAIKSVVNNNVSFQLASIDDAEDRLNSIYNFPSK
jgi:hypothetical protein